MKLKEIVSLLECEIITGDEHMDQDVNYAFGSDLMSDVLAFTGEETVLLTGLCNNQVIRTVEMLDLNAVIFVRGKRPDEEVIALAKEGNMFLACTSLSMYSASGVLYSHGLKGTSI